MSSGSDSERGLEDTLKGAVDERGIPLKSSYPESPPVPVLYTVFVTLLFAIGVGIAYAVYTFGSLENYDVKIAHLRSFDLGWVYIGLIVIKLGMFAININLGVARKACKVNVPDQQVYKVFGLETPGYVLMEQDGLIGKFNRAQRAYMNYLENQPLFLAEFLLAGFVFPFPTFICACIFSVCRIVGAHGYTQSAEDRMKGNMLGMVASTAVEGMVLFAGVKTWM